jgi:hypothetical protein
MSTIFTNPGVSRNLRTADDAGDLTFNAFVFDLANTAYAPTAIANGDKIQIGTVPAGEKLVAHLCRLDIPVIDTDVSPTATGTVGTAASAAAVAGSQTLSASAKLLTAEDFALTTAEVGDANVDTPIYLTFTAAVKTLAATGKIVFEQVSRPVRCDAPDFAVVG